MTLLEAPIGKYKIERIDAGRMAARRLFSLGLLPGIIIEKERNSRIYPVLISIENRGRLVIGRGLASKIIINKI